MARRWRAVVVVVALALAVPAAGAAQGFGPQSPSFFARLWQSVIAWVSGGASGTRVTPDLGPTSDPDG
jgi:hypothetical protein